MKAGVLESCPPVLVRKAGYRLELIAESYKRLTGATLIDECDDIADALWSAPCCIAAHGTEPDPLFIFGNRIALELFEMSPERFLETPSRFSAEAGLREERAALLARAAQDNFIRDYSGIRISATGRRFRMQHATVWNLVDVAGDIHGQAATFARWTRLEA